MPQDLFDRVNAVKHSFKFAADVMDIVLKVRIVDSSIWLGSFTTLQYNLNTQNSITNHTLHFIITLMIIY